MISWESPSIKSNDSVHGLPLDSRTVKCHGQVLIFASEHPVSHPCMFCDTGLYKSRVMTSALDIIADCLAPQVDVGAPSSIMGLRTFNVVSDPLDEKEMF